MVRSTIAYFIFLISIALANADTLCQRQSGDELLLSQALLQIRILDDVQQSFKGYRITCIETNIPLGSLINLNILNGGIGCDSVGLQIKIGKLLAVVTGVNIYGVKAKPGELICHQEQHL